MVTIESVVPLQVTFCKENFGINIQMFQIAISILTWLANGWFLIIMLKGQTLKSGHILAQEGFQIDAC